jgi:diadenosine tetraphosphate (Ap4A) HIT family hydrolase
VSCPLCDDRGPPARVVVDGSHWRVVHEPDPVVLAGKLYVTLQRHAESLSALTDDEAAALGPLLTNVVAALEAELSPKRVHVGSYGEQVRHVHVHVTPRPARLPPGNAATSIAQDVLRLLTRLGLRRSAKTDDIDALVERLRGRLA